MWPATRFPQGGGISDVVILTGLGLGSVLIVFGGIMRPVHRLIWFRVLQPWQLGQTYRRRLLEGRFSGPLLRSWLHITPEGTDRDAHD